MKKIMKKILATLVISACSYNAFADGSDIILPPQALPPIPPQERPAPDKPATSIVMEYDQSKPSNIAEKTRREILAMVTDEVAKVDNVVVIEAAVSRTGQNAPVALDQPLGQFRLFTDIAPALDNGQAIVQLQLRHANHSADPNHLTKPIAETTLRINPQNVRSSQGEVAKFIASQFRISTNQSSKSTGQPQLQLWIEVKNADGSQGVKVGSELFIYYKPDSNVYMNLYYLNEKDEILRLIPGPGATDNYAKANQIYKYPKGPRGLTIVDGNEVDRIRAIFTRIPSGIGPDLGLAGSNLQSRTPPIGVLPLTHPPSFADPTLSRFFSLPETFYGEKEISYTIEK